MVDWIERNRGYILVTIINLTLVFGLALWWRRPGPAPILVVTPPPAPATPASIRVHVAGAVAVPDVYRLPGGSIVKDAVQAAGGLTADADQARVNLALELQDQQQVYVARVGEENVPASVTDGVVGGTTGALQNTRIDINSATIEELATLPGVGSSLAQRIVEYRDSNGRFVTIEGILDVPGIGDATFDKIKDSITVGD
jgi:competence protein ComEA